VRVEVRGTSAAGFLVRRDERFPRDSAPMEVFLKNARAPVA
jgi:hypothetical protein